MSDKYSDDLHDLKRTFKKGVLFSTSNIQRKMFWGYNRAWTTLNLALSNGDAVIDKTHQGIGQKYRFI